MSKKQMLEHTVMQKASFTREDSTPRSKVDAWWRSAPVEAGQKPAPSGLSDSEAQRRRAVYGANRLVASGFRHPVIEILERLYNPLVLLLLVAGGLSAALGEAVNAGIIALMVVMSVLFDYIQEHRAELAAERLRESIALRASVLRNGSRRDLAVDELVPGDVVFLFAGSRVPADGWVLKATDLFVQQAVLTGEPFPVEKHADTVPEDDGLESATNAVFMGSNVLSGSATVLVARIGAATQLGLIGAAVAQNHPPTAFDLGIKRFGYLILRLTLVLVLFVFLANGLAHRPWLEAFLFSLALAVGLTPELLPMIVTVTLSHGALRLAKRGAIVKRLSAMQNLGALDVLCTDKTGTLTEAKISLSCHVDILNRDNDHVLQMAYLNSFFETGIRTPLEEAILSHESVDVGEWKKLDEVPFDFERRRLSVLVERRGEHLLIVKGAPEELLTLCEGYAGDDGEPAPWTDSSRMAAQATLKTLSMEGYRVLGIAWKRLPAEVGNVEVSDETKLIFGGYAAFLDPPKRDAAKSVSDLSAKGISIKIVTGDSELVTQHVCKELGIVVRGVLLGQQIAKLDDTALALQAETANLFCRVSPIQKSRVILALRRRGHVVGFMGDGINDAPALHNADVGISVDGAVDVAKDSADLIMLKHDLTMLTDAVEEGRRTFANIKKYIMMGTSSNFGNMLSMALAAVFLPFLPMLPTQILLNNILYDLSETVLPLDHVDDADTALPQRWDVGQLRDFMLTLGPVSSIFDFATFYVLLSIFGSNEAAFQTGWFLESLCTQVLVIFIIRTRGNPFHSRPHATLWLASLGVIAIAILVPFTPIASYFGFVPLSASYFFVLGILAMMYLAVAQVAKTIFHRYHADRPARIL